MPLKDIMLHADNSTNGAVRQDYAIRLASTHDAHLTGLYVGSKNTGPAPATRAPANYAVPDFGGRSLQDFDRKAHDLENAHQEHARFAAEAARDRFLEAANEAGIKHNWTSDTGALMDVLTHEARFSDVAIVGQPGPDSARRFGETVTDHLILSVGHPVLVVPTAAKDLGVGRRVMIAWDRSPLATRAIHNSRPFTRNADSVHILAINLKPDQHGGEPGSGITEHLARHDIHADVVRIDDTSHALADVIIGEARKLEVDLIIMGAYGQSRLRERILGGTTYEMLNGSPIPMLLNH